VTVEVRLTILVVEGMDDRWGLLWLGEIEIVGPESFVVTFQRPSVDVGMVYTCICSSRRDLDPSYADA
jgi:hypothetical protein